MPALAALHTTRKRPTHQSVVRTDVEHTAGLDEIQHWRVLHADACFGLRAAAPSNAFDDFGAPALSGGSSSPDAPMIRALGRDG
jgi:hypothetical protein